LFTTRAADVAACAMVYVVLPSSLIVPVDEPPVCDVVETVMALLVTAVTMPATGGVNPPPPGAPLGRLPPPPPPGAPDGRTPPAPPAPPRAAHTPLTAGLIATLEAAAALGVVMPTTHDPTVTPEAAVLTACVTVVEAV
jgi:hypothetical protein